MRLDDDSATPDHSAEDRETQPMATPELAADVAGEKELDAGSEVPSSELASSGAEVGSEMEAGPDVEVSTADAEASNEVAATEAEDEVREASSTESGHTSPASDDGDDEGMDWYAVHTYSGYERKVKQSLEERVRSLHLSDEVAEVLIPTQDVVEMKSGKKVVTAKKFFPGYVLVRMVMNDSLWHLVKNTPRVTGFVGAGRSPIPLSQTEVDKILNRMEESVEAPKPKFQFNKSEDVRIIDGPFTNFTGKVEEVDMRRNTLKVMVSIFGRATPVELDFFQVEKV